MAGDNYPGSNFQIEMSPAQDVSCAERLDSPGDVQHTAHADSPAEAVIASDMSSPTEPQSAAMPKPSSIGNVLTKGSVCVPCSPTVQALGHSESELCHKECDVILNLSSSPTCCVYLDKTLVPIECKCALCCSCHMGFDPGNHCDCVSRKEYASLLHQVKALEKALQHQIAQGHNSLLSCHGSHGSPSDVEDNKAKDTILGTVPECSPNHSHSHSHSPFINPVSMAMAQGDMDTNHLLTMSACQLNWVAHQQCSSQKERSSVANPQF